jgi:hypothetical protein
MPPVVRYQVSRGTADCAIVALSIYLERSYEDVLAVATAVTKSKAPHNRGLWTREIKAIAQRLGARLRLRRSFDLSEDEGIAGFETSLDSGHVAFCKRGLVWETDGTIWESDVYCATTGYKPVSLLERVN